MLNKENIEKLNRLPTYIRDIFLPLSLIIFLLCLILDESRKCIYLLVKSHFFGISAPRSLKVLTLRLEIWYSTMIHYKAN